MQSRDKKTTKDEQHCGTSSLWLLNNSPLGGVHLLCAPLQIDCCQVTKAKDVPLKMLLILFLFLLALRCKTSLLREVIMPRNLKFKPETSVE